MVTNRGEEAGEGAAEQTKNRRRPHSRQCCEATNSKPREAGADTGCHTWISRDHCVDIPRRAFEDRDPARRLTPGGVE